MSIENRICGACTVCCIVPPVRSSSFSKTSGVSCIHRRIGKGCAIHATRPEVCRDWFCGFRTLEFLTEAWRPDRCGLLVVPEQEDIPLTFSRRQGLKLIAFREADDLLAPFVVDMIAGLVFGQVPAFVSVPGPIGHHGAKALINGALFAAADRRDRKFIQTYLRDLYNRLCDGDFERVGD